MKHFIITLITIFSFEVSSSETILTIENENISLTEFKNILYKNNDQKAFSKEYLEEYMQLFINFKLKVKEAESLGMDTLKSFVNELGGYRKQLSKPYLKDKDFEENLLKEAYERTKYDLNVSHILVSFGEDFTEKNEKDALNRIINIKEDIVSGKVSFDEAAISFSDDKSAKINKGNLGYFTSFMMVYPFESAAYNCKIGEICGPVKTKYGFHLIKLNDKRDAVGEVKVSHIMFKTQKGNIDKNINAKTKIFEVYNNLKNGDEFEDLAERFSEDKSSAVNGGELPPFGVGKMVPVFEEKSFALEKINDFSEPFETDYGWHIVKLISKKQILPFEDLKTELKRKIERDSRANLSQEKLYEKLRKAYKITKIEKRINQIKGYGEKEVKKGVWDGKNAKGLIFTLFMIDDLKYNQQDFIRFILENQKRENNIDNLYEEFINKKLVEVEEDNLEEKYPEYKALLKEYRDGILLFDLTNKLVWGKAVEDTIGLEKFYEQNKENYLWNDRLKASIYTCASVSISKQVRKAIFLKNRGKLSNKDLLSKINRKNSLNLKIDEGKFEIGQNDYIDKIKWKKGISKDLIGENGEVIIINVESLLPTTYKTIQEVRGKVISDYQNSLDKEWIKELRSKYDFNINYEILHSLID
jgi:peptidyl-prolyl cis-trans isomerase SurA